MEYASYTKRIFSMIIDIIIIYLFILPLYGYNYEMATIFKIIFVWSVIYQTHFHSRLKQTIGEKYVGLKVIFKGKSRYRMVSYLYRAYMRSVVLVPMAFPSVSKSGIVMTIISLVVIRLTPKFKNEKVMVWDIASNTVVVEERSLK